MNSKAITAIAAMVCVTVIASALILSGAFHHPTDPNAPKCPTCGTGPAPVVPKNTNW